MNSHFVFPVSSSAFRRWRDSVRWSAIIGLVLLAVTAHAADLVWIGGSSDWNIAGNWSPAQVPTAADNAFITNSGTYTVNVPNAVNPSVASLALGGASGAQTVSLGRSVLTLNGASVVNPNGQLTLTVGNSTVTGAGNLTVNGALNWASGTISGPGTTSIGGSGVVTINGGVTLTSRTFNNAGHVSWDSGNLTAGSGAAINNLAGGIFDVTFDSRLNVGTAPATFNNSGLLRKTSGAAIANLILPFNNTGTVQSLSGTLSLDGGGTHSGSFSNAPGAILNFGGGSHVLSAGSVATGAGTLATSGNATTLTASGTFDAGSALGVTAGIATLASSCNVAGATLTVSGGVLNFNSAGPVGLMNLTAGTLGGTSPINVTGALTLSGGAITNALVTASGGLNITGGFTLNGGKLINPATALWSAGNFTGANGAVFSNLLGATFINTFDGNAPSGAGATPTFVNAGLFQKTNGTAALGNTSIDFQFINTGTVEVRTNNVRYAINQQSAGLTLLNGGGLTAQAQPFQLLGGSLVGTGLVTVANAQNVINSSAISPGLPLGELDIAGNYQQTVAGNLNIDLGGYAPGTTFDLVTVAAGGAGGVATLGGNLNVSLANGFSPTNGATFTFLTANSRVGAFSTFNYPSNDIGMQVILDATSASVKVTNLKPVVANPIPNPAAITYGAAFNFQFAAGTFSDPDNDPLTYTAAGLPSGITFSSATRTFSGTPAQAGVFSVSVVANDGGNPSLTATNSFTITVNPATLVITAQPQNKVYGAADPALTFTTSGLQLGDTPASVLVGSLTRVTGETVAGGPYAISQGTLAANTNYNISFTGNTLTITPAVLSVTADAKTKVYGAADPAFTVAYAGFVNSETPTVLGGTLGFARPPGEGVGGYLITPGGLTSGNYAITFNAGTLTITKAALSVTADPKTKTYGAADPAFTVTYSGFVNNETAGALGGTLAFTRAPGTNVGSYLITPSGLTSGNYTITFNTGNLSITRAALSITADAKSKIYGVPDPVFTATYAGFVNGETPTVLGGVLAFNRGAGENVGSYLITPSGLTSGNYTITFNTGNLDITKAALSIAVDAKTKIYGATDPALTFVVSGLQFTDTAATVLTGSLTRAIGETVAGGPYALTQGTLTPNGNYSLNFTGNTLTITKAALSVTVDAKTKIYGAADPAFTVAYAGFVNSETPAVLGGTLAFNRAPGENVGSYLITPGGLTSGNYAIAFNTGSLSVTKAALSVTANPITKTYGATEPTLTFTVTGLQFSDTAAGVLTGVLTRVGGETVAGGPYTITQGTLTPNGNYTINFTGNSLTITRAALSVTADAKSKTYGAEDPAFTVSYSGFVLGETSAVLGGTLAFTRAPGENAGSYLITPSGLTSGNYALTFNAGNLSITKATLSVAADAKTKSYGAADPTLTFVTTGLQFNDTAATVLTGLLTRSAGESVAGGPYAITQGTLTPNGNYTISFTGNSLTITQRGLTVTASAKSKTYGATLTLNAATDFTSSGLQNSETIGSVTLIASGAPAGTTATAAAGSYTITPSAATGGTFSAANYSIAYATGTLTVNRAALSVTADAKTKTAGAADPIFTASFAGFVNSETPALLGGTLIFSRVPGESIGSYLITPSGLTSGNYAITFNPGTLTITAPAPQMLPLTVNGSNVTISWNAVSNGVYRVQYKAALDTTNWTDLAGDVIATSGVASKTDPRTSTNRFYRIQVMP
ncbi:MAG: MBG domain-containing protein [Verrucomicrobiota bacterium]